MKQHTLITLSLAIITTLVCTSPAGAEDKVNSLRLETATPKGNTRPAKQWEPYAETIAMTNAALGKQGDTWILFFTNGTGKDACAEINTPTGHILVTLVLPGPPETGAKAKKMEPTDAFVFAKGFNASFPMTSMTSKTITFSPGKTGKGTVVTGMVDIGGKLSDVRYRIAGSFAATRCQ